MDTLEFADDFSGGTLHPFWSTWRIEKGRWSFEEKLNRPAIRIEVRPGDHAEKGRDGKVTERSELSEHKELKIPPKVNAWYSFDFLIPEDFQITNNRLVIAQWKQDAVQKESPPLSLRYRDGNLIFELRGTDQNMKYVAPNLSRARWHTILVNHCIGEDHLGQGSAFLDNSLLASFSGTIGYIHLPSAMYFKMGLYRDHISYSQHIYFARFRRGLSRSFCES